MIWRQGSSFYLEEEMVECGRTKELTRRAMLSSASKLTVVGLGIALIGSAVFAPASASVPGSPGSLQPEETVEETITRLFGDREIRDGGDVITLDVPAIAENGAVVPTLIETSLPMEEDFQA
jgi:predicted secreted protein